MSKKDLISKNYIFKPKKNGSLKFIGNFEDFYKNETDPWGQRGKDKRLKNYYAFSRKNLAKAIKSIGTVKLNIIEIGCGLGYVVDFLQKSLSEKVTITGMDLSHTAINKAKTLFPHSNFVEGNICSKQLKLNKKFDIVIMNQLLWYIIENLPDVFKNINNLLVKNGHLIFVNGFLREQKYGRNIIDGFDGLIKYVLTNYSKDYKIIRAEIDYSKAFLNYDGILILKKN